MESLFPEGELVHKKCSRCGEVKPLAEFWVRRRRGAEKPRSECKACNRSERNAWYEQNKDRVNADANAYKKQNPEWYAAWQSKNRRERRDRWLHNELLMEHGIGLADFRAMLEAQGGVCAICGQPEQATGKRRLAVDHDHVTGRIRGLLCGSCNFGLGKFNDDPERLRAAIRYLEEDRDGKMPLRKPHRGRKVAGTL